jgi:hypothetical protein
MTRPSAVLGTRALNRALLARQMLLRRRRMPPAQAIEHLVGLQAQNPLDPYVALWSRLDRFRPDHLVRLLEQRKAVRTWLMRATIHLMTTRDCRALGPVMATVLARTFAGTQFNRKLEGVDLEDVVEAGRSLLEERPRTRADLGAQLAERWRGRDPGSLSAAVAYLTPVVQVPPRGIWGRSGQATLAAVDAWLGGPTLAGASLDEVVLRYLGAFGPAGVSDARTWSGLAGLGEVFERLRPGLRTFRDERGRELFDLLRAPRPDPDAPAPPRFLPEFDNVFLSHADRGRIIAEDYRRLLLRGGGLPAAVLVDGFVRATWKIERAEDRSSLIIMPSQPLPKAVRGAVAAEGARLMAFAAPDAADHRVRFVHGPA